MHFDPRAGSNFTPMLKALSTSASKRLPWAGYLLKALSFHSWFLAAKMKTPPAALGEEQAPDAKTNEAAGEENAPAPDLEDAAPSPPSVPATDEIPPEPRLYPPDVGGNAEPFQPKDFRQGLAAVKLLWSQAWKAAGSVAAFDRLLAALTPPALPVARALRPSLKRGPLFDCTLTGPAWEELDRWAVKADAILPRSKTPARARRPKEVPQPWEHTLRTGFREEPTRVAKFGRLAWSRDFASLALTPLHDEVIKLDVVLQGKEHSTRYRNHFLRRQAALRRWGEKEAQKLHGTRLWQTDCPKWVWKPLPAKVVRLDLPTRRQAIIAERRAAKRKTWQQLFDIRANRPGAKQISLAFFTHRLEPEKAAGFVTKYGDLLVSEKVLRADKASFKPWREEAQIVAKGKVFLEKTMCPIQRDLLTKQQMKVLLARKKRGPAEETWQKCLLAKLRRWRKGTLHERSCLAAGIPKDFFLHRLETSDDFLSKFGRALTPTDVAEE